MSIYLICLGSIAVIMALYVAFRRWAEKHISIVLKVFSGLLCVVFFIRYFGSTGSVFVNVTHVTANNPYSSAFLCAAAIICVWLEIASITITEIFPYFEHRPLMHNYSKTFCLISSVLNFAFLRWTAYSFTESYELNYVAVFMAIEVAIIFCMSLHTLLADGTFFVAKGHRKNYFVFLPVILIAGAPPYTFGALFGNAGYYLTMDFNFYHRVYLYFTLFVLLAVYMICRKHDKEFIRMVLLFIALATLVSYCYDFDFSRFVTPYSWPLHLCNTAMFILPICLMFRFNWLFYFTFFINVLGAFFALMMPDFDAELGFLSAHVVRFWINHIMAFSMPLLIVTLGVYERPKLRFFIYSMIGFAVYFFGITFINAWFSALYNRTVDFFYTNSDFIVSKLGSGAEALRDNFVWTLNIGDITLTFNPMYQFLFFIVYVGLGLVMWFLYAWLFHTQDLYMRAEERYRKIRVDEYALCRQYGQKHPGDCMNEETKDKLVIKGFYKRYGRNNYYSAENINIEVPAGQVCGFLGSNGAGKSTTIKCVVGIQPPTSGSIEVNGYDVAKQPTEAKRQIGFVPDHYALYENLTGREYINYVADLYDVPKAERDERLSSLLERLSMKDAIDSRIQTYSHGMKQKIAIMSALIHNPKLWILDEPLTGLDPNSVYEIKECMKDHARQGNIVFFSSHLLDVAEKVCDRVIIIKHGRIISEALVSDLDARGVTLEQYYLSEIGKSTEGNAPAPDPDDKRPPSPRGVFFNRPKLRKDKAAKAGAPSGAGAGPDNTDS